MKRSVYLAGPISGLTYANATDWRRYSKDFLKGYNIVGLDPLRGKDYLINETSIADKYDAHTMSTSRAIMVRDYFDCNNVGLILANFLGAKRISIGTVMECAWAYSARIPLILCMEKSGNVHDHSMIREAAGYHVDTLSEGLHIAVSTLSDYLI